MKGSAFHHKSFFNKPFRLTSRSREEDGGVGGGNTMCLEGANLGKKQH